MKHIIDISKLLLGWPLSILAIGFIIKIVLERSASLQYELTSVNGILLVSGIFCFILYFFFRAYVWFLILKAQGYTIPMYDSAYLWELSELKRYIPGNVWSFLSRSILFTEKGINKQTVWLSMITEVQFFLLSSCIVSVFSLQILFQTFMSELPNKDIITSTVVFFVILATLFFIFHAYILKCIGINTVINKILPSFSPLVIAQVLGLSIVYIFFYGLGSYLTITAIVYLSPNVLLGFIGFFVLSLLIGYVSIITPTGLGVREGFITSVLSFIIALPMAGVAAIFSRIVLIFSELLFLFFAILWKKTKSSFITTYVYEIGIGIAIVAYSIYFTTASFLKHDNFYTGRFDLGNMDQTVWSTAQGNILQFTNPNGINTMSRLGFHGDFILALLSPFYFIWSDPKMLLLIQTVVLACGAIFVYMLSAVILKNKLLSFVLSFAFLLNPSIQYSNLYDFHAVTLVPTFLLGAFYFLYIKRFAPFILFLTLAVITKEQIWIIAVFFGAYVFLLYKKKLLGSLIMVVSAVLFYYLMWHIIPNSRGGEHFALAFYSEFGDSPTGILKNIIFDPFKTIATVFQYDRIVYVFQLLMPLGFLSLLSPLFFIFPSADLTINLLSNNRQFHEIYYQYTAAITPFIFISAIYGVQNVLKKYKMISYRIIAVYIFASSLYMAYAYGPLPGAAQSSIAMFDGLKDEKHEIHAFLKSIPKEKKVTAVNNVGAHVSQREYIYTIPLGLQEADIIILYPEDPYVLPSPEKQRELVRQLQRNPNYVLIFQKNNFYAFEKKSI